MFGRIQVQAHDVDQFFDEARIVRDLERLRQVRLQAAVPPYALDGRLADPNALAIDRVDQCVALAGFSAWSCEGFPPP